MKINRKYWTVLGIVYIVFIVIATMFDEQIAAFMYHPNHLLSKIIAKGVYVIACYLVLLNIFILIRLYHQQGRLKEVPKYLILTVAFVITSIIIYLKTTSIIVLFLHLIIFSIFWKFLSSLAPNLIEQLERPAKYSLLVIVIGICSVEGLKIVMGRVRPRSVSELAPFTPWYIRNGFLYKANVSKLDEIKSFPSGHSAWSMAFITLWFYISELKMSSSRRSVYALGIGVWTTVVMISRLLLGAHFLSDTLVGSGLMLLSYYIISIQYYRRYYGLRVSSSKG